MEPQATPLIFVQINDVYFIDARADYSKPGGLLLPRVSSVVKRLRQRWGNQVFFVLPGDFLAPSCMSKLFYGRQMISVLNSMGLDYATFGNHEFESIFTPEMLAKLIRKSRFRWLSANLDTGHAALEESFQTLAAPGLSTSLRLFLTGVLYADDYRSFGRTRDPAESAADLVELYEEALAEEMKGSVPDTFYVALTHQHSAEDKAFAKALPKFRLLMGGHDHDVFYAVVNDRTLIVKAMSNARSIRLNCVVVFDKGEVDAVQRGGAALRTVVESATWAVRDEVMSRAYLGTDTPSTDEMNKLPQWTRDFMQSRDHTNTKIEFLDPYGDHYVGFFSMALRTTEQEFLNLVPEDPQVTRRIERWSRAWHRKSGESTTPILVTPVALNAEDKSVRTGSTNLGNLVADVVRDARDEEGMTGEIGVLNSGAFRIDRVLPKGEGLSQRTLCDLLFHDNILRVYRDVPGARVRDVLQQSVDLRAGAGKDGDGNFLQISGVRATVTYGKIAAVEVTSGGTAKPLDDAALYRVTCNNYIGEICKHYKRSFEGLAHKKAGALRNVLEETLRSWAKPEKAHQLGPLFEALNEHRWRGK